VFGTKGIGEAQIQQALSVYFAAKDAIKAARKESGLGEDYFYLPFPATSESIRMLLPEKIIANEKD
jgi:xanthine dehydrogenase/oxidase